MRARRHRRRSGPLILVLAALAAAATFLIGLVGFLRLETWRDSTSMVDMQGREVEIDGTARSVPSSSATPDGSGRLRVPSVGLDVPLGQMNAVAGRITPPSFTSAYLVRNSGVAPANAADGTVIVVMHSLRGGGVAPGNFLTDVVHARSKVPVGATVDVAGVVYTVSGSYAIPKDELAQSGPVWERGVNRLLLITCLERSDGSPSTDNLVITASRR